MLSAAEFDRKAIARCVAQANLSLDPTTKVGAVLVGADRSWVLFGRNKFAPGVEVTPERLNNRDDKLKLTLHAELDVILQAAAAGRTLAGATLYFVAIDKSGKQWGGAPCIRCANAILRVGISEVKSPHKKHIPVRWQADCDFATTILLQAGVKLTEVPLDPPIADAGRKTSFF
jgi:dCMP deaminase